MIGVESGGESFSYASGDQIFEGEILEIE